MNKPGLGPLIPVMESLDKPTKPDAFRKVSRNVLYPLAAPLRSSDKSRFRPAKHVPAVTLWLFLRLLVSFLIHTLGHTFDSLDAVIQEERMLVGGFRTLDF